MTSVLATSAQGPDSPAFRIRVTGPLTALEDVEISPYPLFDGNEAAAFASGDVRRRVHILLGARRRLRRTLRAAPVHDAVIVQRQVDMLPGRGLDDLAARAGRRVLLDIDDAIWQHLPSTGSHPLARLKQGERKVARHAQRADVVLAGNEILADWLGARARRVEVMPSLVDVARSPVRRHTQTEVFTLGWIGSATTGPFLAERAPQLARFARELPDRRVRLIVVGATPPEVPGVDVDARPWSPAAERRALTDIDVGLMPLPDDAWTRGKCAYKALQYMAAEVPVVADDVGVSAEVIGDGASGLIAATAGGWVDALLALAEDVELRRRLGAEGRRRVADGFSYDAWLPRLRTLVAG